MKVILVNGSPHKNGCTHTALNEVAKELHAQGIETEEIWCGVKPIMGCIGCGRCKDSKQCWYGEDGVNEFLKKVPEADGFVFGSPIHFAGTSGSIKPFMDRAFCSKLDIYAGKLGAAIVSCRRGGAQGGFEDLNRYFSIANMPIVSSNYWNEVHGNTPEEVVQDAEGMQTMRGLGKNMAWLLKCIEAGKQGGIHFPEHEAKVRTNFIR
jgi:multimeric flavodoxin WrbA